MTNPFTSQDDYRETDNDNLVDLLLALDAVQPWLVWLQRHFDGNPPIAFISEEAREHLKGVEALYVNIPRLTVASIAERLYVNGFTGADADLAERIWYDNELDVQSRSCPLRVTSVRPKLHRTVDRPGRQRTISAESARQVSVLADPGPGRSSAEPSAGTPSRARDWGAPARSCGCPTGLRSTPPTQVRRPADFSSQSVTPNPLGCVPCVQFSNQGRLLTSWGNRGLDEISFPARLLLNVSSEIQDVIPCPRRSQSCAGT